MDVCGPWPFNCLRCKHELFSYTYMSRRALHTNVLAFSDITQFCSIYFPPIRMMGLVWSLHLRDGRKPCLLSDHCAWGSGRSNVLSWIFPAIHHTPSFTDGKTESRGSETKCHTDSKFMELGLEFRPFGATLYYFLFTMGKKKTCPCSLCSHAQLKITYVPAYWADT